LKNRVLLIAVSCVLLTNLFFTQVATNLLHTHEAEDNELHQHKAQGKVVFGVSKDKCAICAVHIFNELFHECITSSNLLLRLELSFFHVVFADLKFVTIFSQGRAPPFL